MMCTDLSLGAIDIIRLYGLRFKIEFAVGIVISDHPPRRSEQALLTHSAPTSSVDVETEVLATDAARAVAVGTA